MNPMTRVKVQSHAHHHSRVRVFNHGQDDRVANEGDLLIVSDGTDISFEITIKGHDMAIFMAHVQKAFDLYEANKEYLRQPATREVAAPAISDKSYRPVFQPRQRDLTENYRRWVSTQRDSA
jgi:hypothetical protein